MNKKNDHDDNKIQLCRSCHMMLHRLIGNSARVPQNKNSKLLAEFVDRVQKEIISDLEKNEYGRHLTEYQKEIIDMGVLNKLVFMGRFGTIRKMIRYHVHENILEEKRSMRRLQKKGVVQ